MLTTEIKQKLYGILKKDMIPEYKRLEELKEKIREKTICYLEDTYMTNQDKEIQSKYPDRVEWEESISISGDRHRIAGISVFNSYNFPPYYTYEEYGRLFKIVYGKKLPAVHTTIEGLANTDPKFKKLVWSDLKELANNLKIGLEKLEKATVFFDHPKVNITFIKKNYEELYKNYKNYGADKGSEV
jgi:hypothetical protein